MAPRVKLEQVPVLKRSPEERIKDFDEVTLGYSQDQAVAEAERCLQCARPKCIAGCPLSNDIPGFIQAVKNLDLRKAARVLRQSSVLPGVCSRVCSSEGGCEASCVLSKPGAPIAIRQLERFVADWERLECFEVPAYTPSTLDKVPVAVIGAGPAGLTAAAELAKAGHQVTILEAEDIAGGLMVHGIPPYRLPREVVAREIEQILALGIDMRLGSRIDTTEAVKDLWSNGFGALIIATGANRPLLPGLPGEDLPGVYLASDFLYRLNRAYTRQEPLPQVGKVVAVIGGGDVSIDGARSALRVGANRVMVVYRRSEREMPAQPQEIAEAREEGVEFVFQAGVQGFCADDKGCLIGVECCRMDLQEPDEQGRRRPVPIPGSNFIIAADTVIAALGCVPDKGFIKSLGLEVSDRGGVATHFTSGRTNSPGIWAVGDVVTGSSMVSKAMASARRAARDIDAFLSAARC